MDDARLLQLKHTIEKRSVVQHERSDTMREAAVALLLRPREQLEILLIKRATHERDPWSGHMALPGGRRDASDTDLLATAIRETAEEVGIALRRGDLIGALDEVAPLTARLPPITIAPYVFEVPSAATANVQATEVDIALWVPIDELRNETAASEILIELEGNTHSLPAFKYNEHVVWGLTHRILVQFFELL